MGTLIYIVLIAFCVVLVYNLAGKSKDKYSYIFMDSKPLEMLTIVLCGIILAGVVIFFFKFLFIPLALLAVIYMVFAKCRR